MVLVFVATCFIYSSYKCVFVLPIIDIEDIFIHLLRLLVIAFN